VTERSEGLLTARAPDAARRIALTLLDAASAARERLTAADDVEALHDFRVAMRRLRSTLRAYQPQLDAVVPAKLRRRLRDLARATGEARDVEVQISWLEHQREELPPARRAGVPWLLARLTQRRDHAYGDVRERIAPKFDRLARRLRRALESVPAPDATLPASLTSVIAQLLEDQGRDLERRLALIGSPANHAEAHAARVRVKRARYLLEPVVREAAPAAPLLRRLKQVQQLLGDLHDLHVVIVRLGDAAAEAAAERTRRLHQLAVGGDRGAPARGPRPATSGLLTLARVARATQERLFRRLVGRPVARSLPAELAAFAARLRPPAGLVATPATPVVAWRPRSAPARQAPALPIRYTPPARA
jgi:CHAD domain-containing protein